MTFDQTTESRRSRRSNPYMLLGCGTDQSATSTDRWHKAVCYHGGIDVAMLNATGKNTEDRDFSLISRSFFDLFL